MPVAFQVLAVVASVAAASLIALYATWLLVHRLSNGEAKRPSFGDWARGLFEAIWGL